jgi:uncharacterized protein YerC
MPHVSFNKIDDDKRKALYREFVRVIEKACDAGKGFVVFQEFFTHTEREMFAKRLAVVALLKKQIPVSTIAGALKMSRVTIDTMALKYGSGKYDHMIQWALKEKNVLDILDDLAKNLNTAGGLMPPYIGQGSKRNK